MAELTPMMRQYLQIKEQQPGLPSCFSGWATFTRCSDEDARTGLHRSWTSPSPPGTGASRRRERVPPCAGSPTTPRDGYIARLIAKGYKVAICEQTEDPATAKGLVDRDIIRVVTPGTVTGCRFHAGGRAQQLPLRRSLRRTRSRPWACACLRHLHRRGVRHLLPQPERGPRASAICTTSWAASAPAEAVLNPDGGLATWRG